MTIRLTCALAVWLAGTTLARATDPWENNGDDFNVTLNLLRHGDVQFGHDLEGSAATPDRDWYAMSTQARHSYEARVGSLLWPDECTLPSCPFIARVSAAGAVLTEGVAGNEDATQGAASIGRTIRWIESAANTDYLLALTSGAADKDVYDIALYDTTLFVPRWNNTATQTTVLFLQNTTDIPVQGFYYFHDGAGNVLLQGGVNVPQHGLQVISTASFSALAGRSGSAQIAQRGGYGALVGKAVALEPGTGFTFDTPVLPVAR